MRILCFSMRRAVRAGARPVLALLAALATAALAAPRARASRLVVSSGNSVLAYNETTGDLLGTFIAPGGGGLLRSQGLAFGPDGSLYVSSQDNQSVLRFDGRTGAALGSFVPAGSGGLALPMGLAFGPDGNLYVSSFGTSSILRYDGRTGALIDTFVPSGSGGLDGPSGLTFGPDGNLYVGSGADSSVLRFNGATGAFLGAFVHGGGGGVYAPVDPVFSWTGNLFVNSYYTHSVLEYDGQTGASLGTFIPAGSGGLSGPSSLAFGPDGRLYVASADNDSVLCYDGATGIFRGAFVPQGRGGLVSPTWLAFAPPIAPTGLSLTVLSASQIRLTWADQSDDEDAFAVWRQSGQGAFTRVALIPPNSTGYTDSQLSPNTTYTYHVRVNHGHSASGWSNTASATTLPLPPAAPTGLAVRVISSHQLNLSWRDNSKDETAFTVWRRTGSGSYAQVVVLPPNATQYTDTGLSPRTTYTYHVHAVNNSVGSPWSNEASGTTLP